MRPAPDVPPEIDRQYRRMEWMLYRLRRAHLQAGPAGPAAALASAGARQNPNLQALCCWPRAPWLRLVHRWGRGLQGLRVSQHLGCMPSTDIIYWVLLPSLPCEWGSDGLHGCMPQAWRRRTWRTRMAWWSARAQRAGWTTPACGPF